MIDPDMLQQLTDMAATGRGDFVERVCGLYLEHAVRTHVELEAALASEDLEAIGRAAHALKSMSYNIGARVVAEACAAIEQAARGELVPPSNEQRLAVTSALQRTLDAVRAILHPAPADATPAVEPAPRALSPGEPGPEDLKRALRDGGLWVAYQPIMCRAGETVLGVEALARWTRGGGSVPPDVFIALAERCGLIEEVGEYVLRRACADALAWPGVKLAVNVSAVQLARPGLAAMVERVLAETGLEPSRLELEVTESVFIEFGAETLATVERLRAQGIGFSLDDFGTGYASLTYLRRCTFDKIKIDRSFVDGIEASIDAATIVHAVTSIGRALGMKIVAEGVETTEQHRFLAAAGVHMMQGYLFGRPVPAAEIARQLPAGRLTAASQ
jgi:EAL domain-containing protein (putative c-di-GMP-specific phosphodiesterase class I)/HPt (histidine-containing phosphotransfer) domain-containing protein